MFVHKEIIKCNQHNILRIIEYIITILFHSIVLCTIYLYFKYIMLYILNLALDKYFYVWQNSN